MSAADAEAYILQSEEGRRLLAEVSRVAAPGPADLARWRRARPAELVAAALRLADGRRRGAAKFARAGRMWFEPTGVEQATAEPVARHKARRFSGTVVDLCCGIGGDTIALAAEAQVIAVDLDHGMARRTLWNAGAYEVAGRVLAVQSRAESFPVPAGALVHIDPDRRAGSGGGGGGPRARGVADYVPGLDFLRRLPALARGGAIKLGPASDFDNYFTTRGLEIELVSLAGECKEATVWFGVLSTCRRRATVLPQGASWTDRDGPEDVRVEATGVSAWIFDPDPALIRSGLLDSWAAAHGLTRAAPGIDFLTGRDPIASPFLAGFEVLETLPLDLKRLRRLVRERRLGPLEIKPRGLDLRPEPLRARLRPPGPISATLLLLGGPGPARAVLARRPSG